MGIFLDSCFSESGKLVRGFGYKIASSSVEQLQASTQKSLRVESSRTFTVSRVFGIWIILEHMNIKSG
jgi:hypothetical protein